MVDEENDLHDALFESICDSFGCFMTQFSTGETFAGTRPVVLAT